MHNRESAAPSRAAGWVWVAILLLANSPAPAEVMPSPGSVDSRIRSAAYDADQVYRLRAFVGYQIDLEFEAGESFVGLGAGDLEGLVYFGQNNHLFLKPRAEQVATNFTVLTNRRHYHFDYSAVSHAPSGADPFVIYALRFTYPATATQAAAAQAQIRQIDSDLSLASTLRRQNLDYWYCGGSALRPTFASDDGVHTRLRFAVDAELPAIFVRSEDGTESLINYSMDNGDVVIHRIAHRYMLRRGGLTGCIVNKGYVGGGERLQSGTVAPHVERHVQGGTP